MFFFALNFRRFFYDVCLGNYEIYYHQDVKKKIAFPVWICASNFKKIFI